MTQQATSPQPVLSEDQLYSVYLEVARRDHDWRIRALYGDQQRPVSHTPFRPLCQNVFHQRRRAAYQVPQGAERFQQQLLRRAYYYRVDVSQAIAGATEARPVSPPAPLMGIMPTPFGVPQAAARAR